MQAPSLVTRQGAQCETQRYSILSSTIYLLNLVWQQQSLSLVERHDYSRHHCILYVPVRRYVVHLLHKCNRAIGSLRRILGRSHSLLCWIFGQERHVDMTNTAKIANPSVKDGETVPCGAARFPEYSHTFSICANIKMKILLPLALVAIVHGT
jgi:hypothetical protein